MSLTNLFLWGRFLCWTQKWIVEVQSYFQSIIEGKAGSNTPTSSNVLMYADTGSKINIILTLCYKKSITTMGKLVRSFTSTQYVKYWIWADLSQDCWNYSNPCYCFQKYTNEFVQIIFLAISTEVDETFFVLFSLSPTNFIQRLQAMTAQQKRMSYLIYETNGLTKENLWNSHDQGVLEPMENKTISRQWL